MKNQLKRLSLTVLLAVLAFTPLLPAKVSAAFNRNRLIDDFVFNKESSMSSTQINNFLNGFSRSCISPNSGFQARIPSGYSPSGGFTYGSYGTAGQVIATAAQVYDLNPQVLLVTLEKEQSLVTGRNSTTYCAASTSGNHKYAAAMGYGCPDGGSSYNYTGLDLYRRNGVTYRNVGPTCVSPSNKAGFSQQVIRAAWLLKFGQQRSLGNVNWAIITGNWDNSDDPPSYYGGPMTEGNLRRCQSCAVTYYDGYTTIDGLATHMDTGATAALYWYTPHIHGNQNFVSLFESWFGSTHANPLKATIVDGDSNESGGPATVRFSLVAPPSANVTIPLAINDTSEATLNGVSSIVITPANWNKPENNVVTITGLDDTIGDGDIGYQLVTGDPSSSDAAYGNLKSSDVANVPLMNKDNEPDIAISGDWDGDGRDEIGLKRGNQYLLNYGNDGTEEVSFRFGQWSDQAISGDWDGDGRDEIGLKRGNQYLLNYGNDGTEEVSFRFGAVSDVALSGDWDKDGRHEIGLKRGNTYFLNYGNDGTEEVSFRFGR